MNEKQRKWAYALAVAVFVVFCTVVTILIGIPMIQLAREPEAFRAWVDEFGVWSRLIYVGMVVLQVIVALIPGEPLELAGGYAFGAMEGTVWAMVGIVIGSAMIFALVRKCGVKLVEVFFSKDRIKEVTFLKNPKKSKTLAFILMLIPGTPKDFLSYFAGLTRLTMKEWLVIVSVARIPSLITSTISGGAAGEENYLLAAVLMGATVVLSGAGIAYYRYVCKQQKSEEQELRKAS